MFLIGSVFPFGGWERLTTLGILFPAAHPLERGSAVGAYIPLQMHQATTLGTLFLEAGVAPGADDPILRHLATAARAAFHGSEGLQQGFFLQGALVAVFDGARRAQDKIYDQARQEEDGHEEGGQEERQKAACAGAQVADGPDDEAQPQGEEEHSAKCEGDEQDCVEECRIDIHGESLYALVA
jgi:hypothetical protein